MNVRDGYKITELGVIPNDWEVKPISSLTTYVDYRGKTPTKSDSGTFLVTAKNIKQGYIDYSASKEYVLIDEYEDIMKRGKPKIGDVLFTTEAPCGNVAQIDKENIALAQRVIKFSGLKNKLDNTYLKQYLLGEDFQNRLDILSTGGTVRGIKGSTLHKMLILSPPLPEQQKIAGILSTNDELINKTNELIEKTKEIKKGLMQELLTRGIGHTEFKDSELGRIPLSWEIKNLKEIALICYGKSQKEVEEPNGRYKILGTGGIIGYTNHYLWNEPSVLIGRKGTIDKPKYIEEPFWTVDTLFFTKVSNEHNAKWLFYFLNSLDLKKYNEATGVPSLSILNLNTIKLQTPPLLEQQQIVKILSNVDNKIELLTKRKNQLEEIKKGLMQDLLTGKVRVNCEVNA